jgi:hypothetical protein
MGQSGAGRRARTRVLERNSSDNQSCSGDARVRVDHWDGIASPVRRASAAGCVGRHSSSGRYSSGWTVSRRHWAREGSFVAWATHESETSLRPGLQVSGIPGHNQCRTCAAYRSYSAPNVKERRWGRRPVRRVWPGGPGYVPEHQELGELHAVLSGETGLEGTRGLLSREASRNPR